MKVLRMYNQIYEYCTVSPPFSLRGAYFVNFYKLTWGLIKGGREGAYLNVLYLTQGLIWVGIFFAYYDYFRIGNMM